MLLLRILFPGVVSSVYLKMKLYPTQLFRLLRSPEYVYPQTRSPDGNVTNVVGAGLDELMRHVPSLRPSCIKSLVAAMKEVLIL